MGVAQTAPRGELAIRTVARPRDTNAVGDIFGGWIMSQMDFAGGLTAWWRARGRVATVAVQSMEFHLPVRVGDLVSVYAEVLKVGNTSITVGVETWVQRRLAESPGIMVTQGVFTYVAVDDQGKKRKVPD